MLKVIREILSDLAVLVWHLLTGLFLLAGFNVCIALAALISARLVGDGASGVMWFHTVMGFHGTGLIEVARQAVEIFNWTAFAAMGIFAAHSFSRYCSSASRRAR
jgi:hypothetical protein